MNNFKKYLPSKKFIAIILIIVIIIVLFFSVKGLVSLIKSKFSKNHNTPIQMTISDVGQKDSNKNGIPDYEEYLWGLDPSKNGPENKEYILAKKKTLEENGIITTDDSKSITDNDLLSRQFFATIISLQQTGELNDESMKSVSEALGQNIEIIPIEDIYTSSMLKPVNDSEIAKENYSNAISNLVIKNQDNNIGSELSFIIQGINNKDPSALYAAKTVAEAYISFGNDLMNTPVPKSLALTHLNVANNYNKTGQSIIQLTKVLADPIAGMRAIVSYKKYSEDLSSGLEKLYSLLQ